MPKPVKTAWGRGNSFIEKISHNPNRNKDVFVEVTDAEFNSFVQYVFDTYTDEEPEFSKKEITEATVSYLDFIKEVNLKTFTWGGGDSIDRERVYEILVKDRTFPFNLSKKRPYTKDEIREIVCHEIDCILDSDWMQERIQQALYENEKERKRGRNAKTI